MTFVVGTALRLYLTAVSCMEMQRWIRADCQLKRCGRVFYGHVSLILK